MTLERLTLTKENKIINDKGVEVKALPIEYPKVTQIIAHPNNVDELAQRLKPESADAYMSSNMLEIEIRDGDFFDTKWFIAYQFYKILPDGTK